MWTSSLAQPRLHTEGQVPAHTCPGALASHSLSFSRHCKLGPCLAAPASTRPRPLCIPTTHPAARGQRNTRLWTGSLS